MHKVPWMKSDLVQKNLFAHGPSPTTVPALLPSVNCKILKYNLLRKRGVSVFNTPLLHNRLKISILHFTPRTMGMGNRLRTEGEAEQVEIRLGNLRMTSEWTDLARKNRKAGDCHES